MLDSHLHQARVVWLKPQAGQWELDLDELRREAPELQTLTWCRGVIPVLPRLEIKESSTAINGRFDHYVCLYFDQDMTSPGDYSVPQGGHMARGSSAGWQERTQIFISYSHEDQVWLDRVSVHLRPLERQHVIDVWSDRKILAGSRWKQEIEAALRKAQVAVLLITADFLASDFIANEELPHLLASAEEQGTVILSVIVSPSRFSRTKLAEFQAINDPSKPLIDLPVGEREKVLVDLSYRIEAEIVRSDQTDPLISDLGDQSSTDIHNMQDWQRYINGRFGFSVRFPRKWIRGEESDNGDGCQLRVGDPDNYIGVWARWYNESSNPFLNLNCSEFKHTRLRLASGDTASLIVGRENSSILFDLIHIEKGVEYHLHAQVTEEFFRENRDTLLFIAKAYEVHRDKAIDRIAE